MELLVVMVIMAVMLAFGANMLKDTDKAKGIQSGMDILNSAIDQAREIAKGRSTWTRVVIPYTPEIDGVRDVRHLNFVAVMSWTSNDPSNLTLKPMGQEQGWSMEGRGLDLPPEIYIDPAFCISLKSPDIVDSGKPITAQLVHAKISNSPPVPCIYLEFDRQGRLVWPRGATKLILVSGVVLPNGTLRSAKGADGHPAQAMGTMVMPNGHTTTIRNREQMFAAPIY